MSRGIARLGALAGLVAVAAAACAGPAGSLTRVRVAYTAQTDVGDLPSLMALQALEQAGYVTQATFYARPELAVEALARGDVEFASGGVRAFWAATVRGADLVMVMEHAENGYALVTAPDIVRCEQLTGRRLALSSPGAHPTGLGRAYLHRCPGASPQILDMPGSGDRLAAFAAGAVDAVVIQRSDVVRLAARAPDAYRVLVRFEDVFPNLRFEGTFANRAFAGAHRPVVVDYLRARLAAVRRVLDDPSLLYDEARRWPMMGSLDERIVAAELADRTWDPDGGLQPSSVEATYDFLSRTGSLPASLDPARLADRSFLDAALDSLGTMPAPMAAGPIR